jgi:hypothetical protein
MSSINNTTAYPMQHVPKYQSALVSLVKLRYTDYDAFMERLYEALRGDFKDAIHDLTPVEGKQQALATMIEYFQDKEEYEKCSELKKIKDSLLN